MSDITESKESKEFETTYGDDGVATLILRQRAMGPAFFEELERHVDQLEASAVRAVVVRGAEHKVLSYGLDLPKAFATWGPLFKGAATAGPRRELMHHIKALQRPFDKLFALRVPTICAIHGHCIGGGLDLATACDIRLASRDAIISLRETRVAIVADLGSLQRLPHIIGEGRTRELAFTGRDVTADEALAMGLVNAVYDDADALFAAAHAMARQIAANAPLTVEGVKVGLNRRIAPAINDGLDHVATWNAAFLASEDFAEAFAAFMAKRPPAYKGR
jgi:enoyl-CoA hydratase